MLNPSMCDCKCNNKACKIDEYLDSRNYSCKNLLIGKLVLECKDEILSATETSSDDNEGT